MKNKMCILVNRDIEVDQDNLVNHITEAITKLIENQIKFTGKLFPVTDEYLVHKENLIMYCTENDLQELQDEGFIVVRDGENRLICANYGLVNDEDIKKDVFLSELKLTK